MKQESFKISVSYLKLIRNYMLVLVFNCEITRNNQQ